MRRAALIWTVLLLAAVASAADDKGQTIDSTTEKLDAVKERIDTTQERIRKSARQERSILGSLESADREISEIRRQVAKLRTEERDLESMISATEKRVRQIRKQRDRMEGWLSLRSAALYKAGHVSYLKVILNASGIEDLERRSYYLKKLTEHDSELFALASDLYRSEQDQAVALRNARAQLTVTGQDLEENLSVLSRKRREKGLILAEVRDEKEKNARLLRELEMSAAHLGDLLDALKLQAETGESAFSTLRGSLKRPVSGKVAVPFGRNRSERFNTFTISNGVTFQSAEGTPVRSVYGGKVIYADWLRGYGRIIILDHGSGYYTLYGHLAELKVLVGQEIAADSVIGLVGDSGSLEGPALYFEIRHHGKPVDPDPWFSG
ncbi:MAG: peptidoglycan DD-metalloendopeptidase family protein [bacterium]|nr:MAG: peptidoglycan DD-metalloendopeptidase family protein [bacterium]